MNRQPIRAMVMAAGAGTRLRPLTQRVPKPMVPVAGKPVLEYTLINLRKQGITDVILNLHAYPEQIQNYFGDGSRMGLNLSYSNEPTLMGTAGGVKKAEWFLKGGTFIVMSGDGLTAIDLQRLIRFHHQKKSLATMALSPVDIRFDYGITMTSPAGKISRFVEKPSWGDVFCNQVNSGIYVFEPEIFSHIPARTFYDFGKQVWPDLMKRKKPIYAQSSNQFWCDIGNLSEYRRAHHDVLDGRVGLPISGQKRGRGIYVGAHTVIDRSVKIQGPCWIGDNVRIARGTTLGPYTFIGSGSRIGNGVILEDSILWDRVQIGDHSALHHAIVTHDVLVSKKTSLHDAILIG